TALGKMLNPTPSSVTASACSYTSHSIPRRWQLSAAASPPMPAPTISALMRSRALSGCPSAIAVPPDHRPRGGAAATRAPYRRTMLYTYGHGTETAGRTVEILSGAGLTALVDIRTA